MVVRRAAFAIASTVVLVSVTNEQSLNDPALRVQVYAVGFDQPTGAVFLNDRGDLLVTQKDDGRVILVRNRRIAGTALDLPVANDSERGLLSIALSPNFATDNLVYLYHTAAPSDGAQPVSNQVDRYRLVGDQLVFDRKILDMPPGPGPNHDGGKIMFDAKGKLVGLLSHGDLLHAASSSLSDKEAERNALILQQPVRSIMQREVLTVQPTDSLIEAGKVMWESKIGCLPVVNEGGALLGILTKSDFIRVALQLLGSDVKTSDVEDLARAV